MNTTTLALVGIFALVFGAILGYVARQAFASKKAGTAEDKLRKLALEAEQNAQSLSEKAKADARAILEKAKVEEDERRKALLQTEQLLLKREEVFDRKSSELETKEKTFQEGLLSFQKDKEGLQQGKAEVIKKLETLAKLSEKEALDELYKRIEDQHGQEIMERIKKLEAEGENRFSQRAKEIIAYAIQKSAVPQTQELTTTTLALSSEDIKGKIIGKEGRNIRALERAAGVEVIVDETPEAVVISGFDPVRRHVAKVALERLIKDGRIQPSRIEEEVAKAQSEVDTQMKEAGEAAAYDLGIVGLDPRLVQLLGRLRFRTSYGQNVLLHSVEVAHLASALASEIGANATIAKKAGLFHDIGKALDHQVEGSHVEIGMRVLEKFGAEKEVIDAMKSHHEQFPYESIEAILVQTADAISASRPGARKDTLENYLKRIGELETLASSFEGVEKAYAIQAGREIRVFVKPGELDDLNSQKLAKDIAKRIEEELRYPGEIKVTLIRENRFVEFAR
ncbi:MAG: ribonuclease Y [bacterium]|nr:ribonuclease Y [Candidatus Wildermuthbacteria bacterium]MDP2664485.1 ribonuclease Y [bacterium]